MEFRELKEFNQIHSNYNVFLISLYINKVGRESARMKYLNFLSFSLH